MKIEKSPWKKGLNPL